MLNEVVWDRQIKNFCDQLKSESNNPEGGKKRGGRKHGGWQDVSNMTEAQKNKYFRSRAIRKFASVSLAQTFKFHRFFS